MSITVFDRKSRLRGYSWAVWGRPLPPSLHHCPSHREEQQWRCAGRSEVKYLQPTDPPESEPLTAETWLTRVSLVQRAPQCLCRDPQLITGVCCYLWSLLSPVLSDPPAILEPQEVTSSEPAQPSSYSCCQEEEEESCMWSCWPRPLQLDQ